MHSFNNYFKKSKLVQMLLETALSASCLRCLTSISTGHQLVDMWRMKRAQAAVESSIHFQPSSLPIQGVTSEIRWKKRWGVSHQTLSLCTVSLWLPGSGLAPAPLLMFSGFSSVLLSMQNMVAWPQLFPRSDMGLIVVCCIFLFIFILEIKVRKYKELKTVPEK